MNRGTKSLLVLGGIVGVILLLAMAVSFFVLGIGSSQQSVPNYGAAVGGANDVTSFRANIEQGYIPQPDSLSYAGIYHDYYFESNPDPRCDRRVCLSTATAVSPDPIANEADHYISLGLASDINKADLEQQRSTVVIVLDVSGSMSSPINRYHYDDETRSSEQVAKIVAAKRAIRGLTDQLGPEDRFALVTFEDSARTHIQMRSMDEDAHASVDRQIDSLQAGGGTNLAAGMDRAENILKRHRGETDQTRVIYVTDAQPNQGDLSAGSFRNRIERQADRGIYTTLIGVGVDFNARLGDTINDVEGANQYTVRSGEGFSETMETTFSHMMTPLATDLQVEVHAGTASLENVYGVPSGYERGARTVDIGTIFPSRRDNGSSEGGVILAEFDEVNRKTSVEFEISYGHPDGATITETKRVTLRPSETAQYDHRGIRKAILLTRYTSLLRNWMAYERGGLASPPDGVDHRELSQWEQTSKRLQVSPPFDRRIEHFRAYFENESIALDDPDLEQERAILDRLYRVANGRE